LLILAGLEMRAMKEIKAKEIRKRSRKSQLKIEGLPYSGLNYVLFGLGILFILFGYYALAQPPADNFMSLTVAPILLVVGYCVIIPVAIMYLKKSDFPKNGKGG